MFTSEFLLQAFIVIVIVNIAILELAVFLLWRRRRTPAADATGPNTQMATSNAPANASTDGQATATGSPDDAPLALASGAAAAADATEPGESHDGADFMDAVTGLETASVWYDALRHEDSRRARYGHPTTVMVMELMGFELLGDRLGQDVADRLIIPVAATLLRNSRAADRIARVGHTRFQVLMPETDEISAINYVERVREATDMWLEAGAVTVRTAIGWASPPSGGSLDDAMRLADERMQADRHARPRPRATNSGSRPGSPVNI
jgi:diguanylate cyclase (GGDEF)-like protein